MDDIKYKRLSLSDLEDIVMEYNKNDLENFLKNKENYLFVGLKDNKVIALLYGYGMLRLDGRKMFYIHSVDVIPEYQNQGIGTEFIDYTLKYIKQEKEYYKYFVLADIDNIKACKLYQKYANRDEQVLFSNNL